ncbi:MAG: FAD binding domain-containing protein, partial [Dehalococcoidia bacterium]|nr:FAD binding domain-containing protein [Dehalococcoidia bacterium]MDP2719196.1 FAD binding domain-containing protein [Dehalococcoidia bacterium]
MSLPKFEYIKVKSIGEVCEALGKYKRKAKVMAGGTDLLVQMK